MPKLANVQLAPDLAKAGGILLVVFGHVLRGLVNADIIKDNSFWGEVDKLIYLFHMPLFFFLSGLFFKETLNRRGYKPLVFNNIYALLIPLIVWSYLQFSLQFLAADATNSKKTFDDVLTAPFPPREQFWFLWTLFQLAVLCGALMQFKRHNLLLSLLAVIAIILNLFGLGDPDSKIFENTVIRNAPYFILGIMGGVNFLSNYKIKSITAFLVFLLSLAIYSATDSPVEAIRLITSFLCLLSIYKISLNFSEVPPKPSGFSFKRFFIFIGMNSMIIYLAHVICEAGFRSLLLKLGVVNVAVHLAGGTFVGLLAPLLLVPVGVRAVRSFPRLAAAVLPVRVKRS